VIVVLILLSALVLRFNNKLARLLRVAAAGGLLSLPVAARGVVVGGRCDTQSWTRRETLGFESKFLAFSDWALVVIMMVG
jgi:hypothetical protein